MKKRIVVIALLLIAALSFAILAACDPTESEPTKFTVSFAGEGVTTAPQTVTEGNTAIEPKNPTRDGYEFRYWYLTDANTAFDFDTPITGDITLNAFWQKDEPVVPQPPQIDPTKISGEGTADNPYLLQCAPHLTLLSTLVSSGSDAYAKGHFRLEEDVDLDGYQFSPIGTYEHPFEGKFDGNGKTISNLTLNPVIRSDGFKFYGLFGVTETAAISNLKLDDINYDIESYRDGDGVDVYIGGVAGYASLTQFTDISVNGKIITFLMADNGANIGGIAGWYGNSSSENAYIVYTENCFVNIEMGVDEQDGEVGSLQNARVGGLFGAVYNQNCSTAIINSSVYGKVYGGQYAGGITGYINGLTSIIDCLNAANVTATSTEVAYAGGIVGSALDDNLIMDCVSIGSVTAPKAAPNLYNYKSYAGGITGYAESDDYEVYFSAGSSVVNCFYTQAATCEDVVSALGTKYAASYFNSISRFVDRVKWNADCWTMDGNTVKPTDKTAKDLADKYTLTLENSRGKNETVDKPSDSSTVYSLVGILSDLSASDNNVFWAWELASGVQYKYYMPVVKNFTLSARWQDVTDIAKYYKGTGTLHETIDAGSIILNGDGTLQWITDSATGGTYRFDGTHILIEIYSNVGSVSGTVSGNILTFDVDAGMTGTVNYSFTVYEPVIIGEYISDKGNLLTFAGDNRVSYENEIVNGGAYVSGTYTVSGKVITPTFSSLDAITAGNIELKDDGSILFNFTQNGEAKTETFRQLGVVDYSDEAFIGTYNYVWFSSTSYQEKRQLRFEPSGIVAMISPYSETLGRYYYIESTGILKVIIENAVSNFKYDATEDVVYGNFYRGGTTNRFVVLNKVSRGEQSAYSNYGSDFNAQNADVVMVFAVADGKNYVVFNNTYKGLLSLSQAIVNGTEIEVEQVRYRVYDNELRIIGVEQGEYTYETIRITLDGVSRATITGADAGTYYYIAHADGLVTIVLDNSVIVFDYKKAQQNGNAATSTEHDGLQGVWYNARGENPYYQKIVFDGFGHVTIFYMPEGSDEYRLNWGGYGWGSYQKTVYGALAYFNSNNKDVRFVFYYDGNFAYTPDSFAGSSSYTFIKKGYTGITTPPVFPSDKAGSYVSGEGADELVLNLRADLSGTYRGNPLTNVMYDGNNRVYFTCNSVNYTFTLTQNGGTLDYGADPISFTLAGAITEIIPSALCGVWTGEFSGYGVRQGFLINADGTVYVYTNVANDDKTQASNVKYNFATATLTFTSADGFDWILVYDTKEQTISAEGKNSENTSVSASLTKKAQ